jgi:tetratricopeptide (TPR) repeat protein
MRPGEAPIRNLALAFATALGLPEQTIEIRRILHRGREAAVDLLAWMRERTDADVCVLVDQFEEIFRYARETDREEAEIIADVLVGITSAQDSGVFAIATMRSEFLADCSRFTDLAGAVNRTQYLLPRMERFDLLRAVQEPAQLAGGKITNELAERLITEARDQQDELPLVQHALARLWRVTTGTKDTPPGRGLVGGRNCISPNTAKPPEIGELDYDALGGRLDVLLSKHADAVLSQAARDPTSTDTVEQVFRALTDIDPEGRAIRRPQRFGTLLDLCRTDDLSVSPDADQLVAILAPFRADGVSFLTPFQGADLAARTIIDIAHEAVIRCWQKISDKADGWLQKEFQDSLIWRSLVVHAQNPDAVLDQATTGERWPWFERIRTRPVWARRYAIATAKGVEKEWAQVAALMERSHARWVEDVIRLESLNEKLQMSVAEASVPLTASGLVKSVDLDAPNSSSIEADSGSVSLSNISVTSDIVGRDKVTFGLSANMVSGLIRSATEQTDVLVDKISGLSMELGISKEAIRQFLLILGEQQVPAEQLFSKLSEIAMNYNALRAQMGGALSNDPAVTEIVAEVQMAFDHGDFDRADALLLQVQGLQYDAVQVAAAAAAATQARRAQIAFMRLRYREAAILFADAAKRVPPEDETKRLGYLSGGAEALFRQGDEFGDNSALAAAIDAYRATLQEQTRERVPLQWASTQNNLGTALRTLGERESGTARLEEAVAAYRAALQEWTRERAPLDWAMAQNNLGRALTVLGERESGTARLEEAVAAYRGALAERSRERVPLDWATTQNNLGTALQTLGERESGTARLEEAVASYRTALEEQTRERVPLQWASTQNNLGSALTVLGERESGTARLEEAVAAYRAALAERSRERVPLQWAMTQNNLGTALARLGQRESGTARLEEAVAAYRAALAELTRERVPLDWAMTQNNLGTALQTLGERESGTARLEEAVAAYRAALAELTRERVPLQWAMTQNNLGNALSILGGTAHLEEAVDAYRAALSERTRERVPLDWAMTQNNLGSALSTLGERESGTARLEEAVAAFDAGLTVTETAWPEEWVHRVRSHRDEIRAELTRQRAMKSHGGSVEERRGCER